MGESESGRAGADDEPVQPPPGRCLCAPPPGFGKYEPGAYPFVGLARVFHGIGAMKKAMRLATAPSSGYLRMYV